MREMNEFQQEKKGMGCVAKGLIGCAVMAVVFIIGGSITGYYVFFHTAVPAKALVGLLNQDPNIQIDGVSGSISSGFAVETMRFTDNSGNVNALDDVRLKYEKDGDLIVITEVHVGRGYFYIDRSKGEATFTQDGQSTTVTTNNPPSSQQGANSLKMLIKSVSINDITVEDVSTGETFKLDGIQLDNLSVGDEFSMGKLIVESTSLDLKVIPKDGAETGSTFTVDGTVKPSIHENVIAPITLKGSLDGTVKKNVQADLTAFDGKLIVKGGEKEGTITLSDFTLADYFKKAPPASKVNLVVDHTETTATAKGSFNVGANTFVIDQTLEFPKDDKSKEDPPLIGICTVGTTTYTIEVDFGKANEFFPRTYLSTKPAVAHEDAVATLLTGNASYAQLSAEEKEHVDGALNFLKKADPTKKKAEKDDTKAPAENK